MNCEKLIAVKNWAFVPAEGYRVDVQGPIYIDGEANYVAKLVPEEGKVRLRQNQSAQTDLCASFPNPTPITSGYTGETPWAVAPEYGGWGIELYEIWIHEWRVVIKLPKDFVGVAAAALVPAAKLAIKAGRGAVKLVQRVKESEIKPLDKVATVRARFEKRRAQGGGDVLAIRAPLRVSGVEIGCANCKNCGGQ
ncbi:hypothetical protein L6R46_04375 [Myxococcota bacterium]|nr:hypothetical protein [Myxococcota bacterium]